MSDPSPTPPKNPPETLPLTPSPPAPPERPAVSAESIMAEYLEQVEKGHRPKPGEYLCRHPQHAAELRSFFENHHWMADDPLSSPESLLGQQIGPYRIETEIARGGMGIVYRARQIGLERVVALKLIGSGILAGAEERARFRIEAEAAACLQHPGIVPIHDTGCWQGHEYFSMSLIEGPTLASWVQTPRSDFSEIASAVRDIARAVAYANRRGIVHRDLKPENILLAEGGRPMVTDFGLAKWHRDGTVVTRTGQVLGTPNYMSPEQAAGFSESDARVDVYAVGAILYALLTGRPPHQGRALAEVLRSVLQDEPVSPRRIRSDVPADLEAICGKAMRFQADERYPTADDLADDLQRYLSGEAPEAHASGLVDLVARELHRDQHQMSFQAWGRTLKLLGVIILVAHVIIFAFSMLQAPIWLAYWIPRLAMLAALVWLIGRSRDGSLLPRTVAERPLWSIWLGYLSSLGTVNVLLATGGIDQAALFPIASAMSGFGFIAMSGHIWGGSALLGLAFLIIAPITVVLPATAPLWFGGVWWFALYVLGKRYVGSTA